LPPPNGYRLWTEQHIDEIRGSPSASASPIPVFGDGWARSGARQPIQAVSKVQDDSSRAGIGQLPCDLACLFAAVEPVQGFMQK
jgi:hypothetical protein